jgi:LmbE family N-acetylglucosaminyl deacetylase
MLWESFVMRFEEVLSRYRRQRLTATEAGELLGVSERHFRRLCGRYEEEGVGGLADRRLGRVSPRRAPAATVSAMCELYRDRYRGFNAKHFHEHLQRHHDYKLSYTFTRLALQSAGELEKTKRRGGHRQRRPRRPCVGMMVHQDGSRHEWLPGFMLDLIVTMDDATNEIYSAFLVEEEGTMSSFQGLHEVVARHGLFCSLYTDRGGHYFYTPEAGEPVDKNQPTQVGRALKQLGIEHIAAYSPQARGRSERMFGTLQDRLPKELGLAGITDRHAANRFIAQSYLPIHNARFKLKAELPQSAFVPDRSGAARDILCLQEERVVGNDNTVRYHNLILQLPPSPLRAHFVKAKVRVHEYPDGTLAIFHGPRRLARYAGDGQCLDHATRQAA